MLPASQSAAAASTLRTTWRERFTTWSDDATDQHTTLHRNADNYDAAEHAAARRIAMIGPYLEPS